MAAQAAQLIRDQQAAYAARAAQRHAELQVLESQYQQKIHEVEEQNARKKQMDRGLALAIEQRDIAYPLLQRRNYSKADYLALQQKVVQLQGDIESLAASIPKTQAAAGRPDSASPSARPSWIPPSPRRSTSVVWNWPRCAKLWPPGAIG